jgi:hypothetical protein
MNSVPASARGAASGVRATGMNAGQVISMGGFFTLMAIGLAARLPHAMNAGLIGAGVDPAAAHAAADAPPAGLLFSAFLGYNPVRALVPAPGTAANTQQIYGTQFFPHLISEPFRHGLLIAFTAAIVMLVLAAWASLLRGGRFVHEDAPGEVHHDSVAEAIARQGGAVAVPAVLDADYDPLSDREPAR